jgi:hypothetical protein
VRDSRVAVMTTGRRPKRPKGSGPSRARRVLGRMRDVLVMRECVTGCWRMCVGVCLCVCGRVRVRERVCMCT